MSQSESKVTLNFNKLVSRESAEGGAKRSKAAHR